MLKFSAIFFWGSFRTRFPSESWWLDLALGDNFDDFNAQDKRILCSQAAPEGNGEPTGALPRLRVVPTNNLRAFCDLDVSNFSAVETNRSNNPINSRLREVQTVPKSEFSKFQDRFESILSTKSIRNSIWSIETTKKQRKPSIGAEKASIFGAKFWFW